MGAVVVVVAGATCRVVVAVGSDVVSQCALAFLDFEAGELGRGFAFLEVGDEVGQVQVFVLEDEAGGDFGAVGEAIFDLGELDLGLGGDALFAGGIHDGGDGIDGGGGDHGEAVVADDGATDFHVLAAAVAAGDLDFEDGGDADDGVLALGEDGAGGFLGVSQGGAGGEGEGEGAEDEAAVPVLIDAFHGG